MDPRRKKNIIFADSLRFPTHTQVPNGGNSNESGRKKEKYSQTRKHTKWRLKNITHPTVKKSLSVGGSQPSSPPFSSADVPPQKPQNRSLFWKKSGNFHFVALLRRISHSRGATSLSISHKFRCNLRTLGWAGFCTLGQRAKCPRIRNFHSVSCGAQVAAHASVSPSLLAFFLRPY
jgi:hypothetical protein